MNKKAISTLIMFFIIVSIIPFVSASPFAEWNYYKTLTISNPYDDYIIYDDNFTLWSSYEAILTNETTEFYHGDASLKIQTTYSVHPQIWYIIFNETDFYGDYIDISNYDELRIWFYGNNSGDHILFWIYDSSFNYENTAGFYDNFTGWQRITFNINSFHNIDLTSIYRFAFIENKHLVYRTWYMDFIHLVRYWDSSEYEGLQINFNLTYSGIEENGLQSNCKKDFSDLRFSDVSTGEVLSAYNATQVNEEYINIWLKLGKSLNIFIHYGNPTATPYWEKYAVFNDVILNPVLALHLDEGIGSYNFYDDSVNNFVGTLDNSSNWGIGVYGNCFHWDYHLGDSGTIPHNETLNIHNDTYTISFWVRMDYKSSDWQWWMDKEYYQKAGYYVVSSPNKYNIGIGFHANSSTRIIYTDINPNIWYHFVGIKNNTYSAVYVNGVFNQSRNDNWQQNYTNTQAWFIDPYSGNYEASGDFDELIQFDYTLQDSEIYNIAHYYCDSKIISGAICCRVWVDKLPVIFMGYEVSKTGIEAEAIAVFSLVVGFFALLLVLIKRK